MLKTKPKTCVSFNKFIAVGNKTKQRAAGTYDEELSFVMSFKDDAN